MKKVIVIFLVVVFLAGCNPFGEEEVEVTIKIHPDSRAIEGTRLSNFKIGDTIIGTNLPETVVLKTGTHNASWVYRSYSENSYSNQIEIKKDGQVLKLKRLQDDSSQIILKD